MGRGSVVVLGALLGGCGGAPFDQGQACVLARAWLHDNEITTEDGDTSVSPSVCSDFASSEEDGWAKIDVDVHRADNAGGTFTVECSLFDSDQGWFVDLCAPE